MTTATETAVLAPVSQQLGILQQRGSEVVEKAHSFEIIDDESYQAGAGFLAGLKTFQKEIKETFVKSKKLTDEAHKAVVAAERKHLQPTKVAEKIVKDKMLQLKKPPVVKGISIKDTHYGEVRDMKKVIKGILDGVIPIDVVMPNQRVIDKLASAMGGTLKYPGIVFKKSNSMSSRAA